MARKTSEFHTDKVLKSDPATLDKLAENVNGSNEPEKQHRERRYNASVYLDTSDASQFYMIIAAGTVIHAVFEFNPSTCAAIDRSSNRMLMAAARTLLKEKGTLTKLATFRLESSTVGEKCQFHPDNFSAVFNSLAVCFALYMPKVEPADK